MVQIFKNRQEIAGLPALSVVAFLADDDPEASVETIGSWFHLDEVEARTVVRRLENEGYIEPVSESPGCWSKTSMALEVAHTQPQAAMSEVERDNLVLALMRAVSEINVSPATAHRVRALTFFGITIVGAAERPPIVEALVEISPITHADDIQAEIEILAAGHADRHPQNGVPEGDPHARSIHVIKEALWSVNERLSLRFVMRLDSPRRDVSRAAREQARPFAFHADTAISSSKRA